MAWVTRIKQPGAVGQFVWSKHVPVATLDPFPLVEGVEITFAQICGNSYRSELARAVFLEPACSAAYDRAG